MPLVALVIVAVVLCVPGRLEACGIAALAVHCRKVHHRSRTQAALWEDLPPLVDALSIPVVANGDIFCMLWLVLIDVHHSDALLLIHVYAVVGSVQAMRTSSAFVRSLAATPPWRHAALCARVPPLRAFQGACCCALCACARCPVSIYTPSRKQAKAVSRGSRKRKPLAAVARTA